jgi:hypothetical protein
MLAVIAGLVLVLTAVLLWTGTLTLVHALAIFIGVIGVLLALYYAVPVRAWRR